MKSKPMKPRLHPNYHLSMQNQNNFCTTEEAYEDDYVSQISNENC